MLVFESYFTWSNPLAMAHAVVWALAVAAFVLWHLDVRRLRMTSATVRSINEFEYRQHAGRVEKYDNVFDFLASAFVLIGLAGTIIGFVGALPRLREPSYDFAEFTASLTVSGLGILWSILLYAALAVYRLRVLAPALEELQRRQSVEELATILAKSLGEVTSRISERLGTSLDAFAAVAKGLDGASRELAAAATFSSTAFKSGADEAAQGLKASIALCNDVRDLPEETLGSLKKALDEHRETSATLWAAQREHMGRLVDSHRLVVDDHFKGMHESYLTQLDAGAKAIADAMERTTTKTLEAVQVWATRIASKLGDVPPGVPEEIRAAHRSALEQVTTAAQRLTAAGEQHGNQTQMLTDSLARLDTAITAFSAVARGLPEAIAAAERADLAALEHKLDRLASTVDALPRLTSETPRGWWLFGRGAGE